MTMPGFQLSSDREDAIDSAIRSLVARTSMPGEDIISLPMFHPSGACVSVSIHGGPTRFRVSDGGQAYREAEMIGAQHNFSRTAEKCAQAFGVTLAGKMIVGDADVNNLAGFIADIGAASAQISARIVERAAARAEAGIEDRLRQRLRSIFGDVRVVPDAEISGASNHKWRVSAVVHVGGRDLAFEAVANHHSSVYSSATMFHDLALLENRPKPIAVVESKQELGSYLLMLSQAANVIEASAPDRIIEQLAA